MTWGRRPTITLTTDYGGEDGYAGILKGVILRICPDATLVDITHEVPPRDVLAATLTLRRAVPYFPPDTVHLVVVDPGVGTSRRAVAAISPQGVFVGPDNGIPMGVLPADLIGVRLVHLDRPQYWLPAHSATFQGRDIFAPVAAYLAAGASLVDVGSPIVAESLAPTPWPNPLKATGCVVGTVIHVDHFGNLISNIDRSLLEQFTVGKVAIESVQAGRLVDTYGDRAPGQLIAYFGSSGLLEFAVVNGNAATTLNLRTGACVRVAVSPAPHCDAAA